MYIQRASIEWSSNYLNQFQTSDKRGVTRDKYTGYEPMNIEEIRKYYDKHNIPFPGDTYWKAPTTPRQNKIPART